MARRSSLNHQFNQNPQARIPRSSFSRNNSYKSTGNVGLLYPMYIDEVLPGDTHNVKATMFGRIATPLKPVMDNLFLDTFWFFCPTRLLWDNWQRFNGEQDNPTDSIDFTVPQMGALSMPEAGLADYFGLPTQTTNPITVNALPFRMYNRVFHEWFRDENLQNAPVLNTDDGPDSWASGAYPVRRRGKRKDYFTSALPWEQKGDPVTVPLGLTADVTTDSAAAGALSVQSTVTGTFQQMGTAGATLNLSGTPGVASGKLYADLANATGFTINQLRESFQIQKLLERDARGGTRYTEILRSHFGVISPDARLQRPEFLGGSTTMININPVEQTSSSSSDVFVSNTPQGNLSAYGTVYERRSGFIKSFTEHGYIMGLWSVRADLTYQQGIHRLWSRQGRYDFFWPALAHLGEQAILNKEIYSDGSADDDNVFGYIPRWDEYRYRPNQVTGKFRSNATGTLHFWHYAYDFQTRPALNDSFIQENPPINRTLAVQDEPHLLVDAFFKVRSARPMPTFGIPGLIDHF